MRRRSPIRHIVRPRHPRYRVPQYSRGVKYSETTLKLLNNNITPFYKNLSLNYKALYNQVLEEETPKIGFERAEIIAERTVRRKIAEDQRHYKTVYVKIGSESLPQGYGGMNYYASQDLGLPWKYSRNTILIGRGQSKKDVKETKGHEIDELEFMRENPNIPYKEAHDIITERERKTGLI